MSAPAVAADPAEVGTRWLAAMRAGDWETAWQQTDRLELPRRTAQQQPGFMRQPHHLCWDGSRFDGRSVLVRCEHGLGDTLQYLRFVPALARRARELHLMVQPPLVRLLQGAPGLGHVHDGWQGPDWPAHELEIEVMELAYAQRAQPHALAPPYPHLPAQLARLGLQVPLRRDGRLQAGLLWAASDWDSSRSVPLDVLAPLFAVPGIRWHALQQGPAAEEATRGGWPLEPLWRQTATVEAAACALQQMDLVVSIDGMPAHLAGTLGRPLWLMLKHTADWRWMERRSDSPWYPSARLFRQPRPSDWAGVVAQVADALRARPAPPR